jgi:hypothetical protein
MASTSEADRELPSDAVPPDNASATSVRASDPGSLNRADDFRATCNHMALITKDDIRPCWTNEWQLQKKYSLKLYARCMLPGVIGQVLTVYGTVTVQSLYSYSNCTSNLPD